MFPEKQLKPDKPRNYPYVKFLKKKEHLHFASGETLDRAEPAYLNLSGTHGNDTETLISWVSSGMAIVDYANLKMPDHAPIKQYCDQILGRNIDPDVMEALNAKPNPMRDKINNARSEKNEKARGRRRLSKT